jgi:diadenosine tetraphosphatase ApaH/serine/threonine PP2A family protein phosphatase
MAGGAHGMKCLVISDIHANLTAFEAVLADAKARNLDYDVVWCLGDVVGYGPDPEACVDLLRTLPHVCLAGNHDWAVLGKLDLETFNENANLAIQWTRDQLSADNLRYLQARPERIELGEFMLVHASPRKPIWEYVLDIPTAEENFAYLNMPFCLVGHTHVPMMFTRDSKSVRASYPEHNLPAMLRRANQYIINAGSVGQPRDGDPRAAYAILDVTGPTWTPYRVAYDVAAVQTRMRAAGLPEKLIARIEKGW